MLRGSRIRQLGLTQTFAALALLAIVVRAIVPAGYMVAPEQDGRFVALVLCSGHSQGAFFDRDTGEIIDADTAHERQSPANPQADGGPCVFAAMAPLAGPETPSAILAPYRHVVFDVRATSAVIPGRGLAAPPPWATGPPQNA